MPIARFQMPDGRIGRFEVPEGTTPEQAQQAIAAHLAQQPPARPARDKPFGEQLNNAIADVPRQLGLTARYGIEGVGDALDFLSSPIRAGLNAVLPTKKPTITDLVGLKDARPRPAIEGRSGKNLADSLGLPEPANARERVVGDVTRMIAGGVVPIAAAGRVAQGTSGVTNTVAKQLASNPLQQMASAGAAGAAGGYTRETGGNDGSQLLAALAAGVAAPAAMNGVQRLGASARQALLRPAPTEAQIDIQINRALSAGGQTLAQIAPEVRATIRQDVAQALKVSDNLEPDALRRLVDYRATGLTPTVGKLTRNPAAFTQEENLMRVGANSKDPAAQTLGNIKNDNNNRLIEMINGTGASTSDDALSGGQKIMAALRDRDTRASNIIGRLYDRARDSGGRSAPLDPRAFTQRAGDLLHDSNVESFLTPDIRNKLNGFATGQVPLTVEIAEQFKTGIGRLQRNSTDGNVRHALGLVRQALDETPLMSAPPAGGNQLTLGSQSSDVGQKAIDAFNRARRMNRGWMQVVERTPALQAVRDGVEPDRFVQQFIVGGGPKANVADVEALHTSIAGSSQAMDAVKGQIAASLKKAALSGASDEVGAFSQSGYNKALAAIGERKLGMFFTPQEVEQLKALGRVASYEQKAPVGAAVNYSNSGGAIAAVLDRIVDSSVLSKFPGAPMLLQQPAENILVGMRAKSALDASKALQMGVRQRNPLLERSPGLMLSPALLMGEPEERR